MRDLRGRVAVVTGGANGIGKGLATRFLTEGMAVVIADNDRGDLDRATAELSALGEVLAVPTDVADATSVQALADAAVARFGAVHVLCNNAGVGGAQRFSTIGQATWEWTLGVNLFGVIHGCRIFLPILAAQDEAYIVNTASMSGFLTGGYLTPYNVSKAGVVSLTEGLAFEWAEEFPHIGVAALCPAYTATAIRHDERNAPPGHVPRAAADPALAEHREQVSRTIEQEGLPVSAVADLVVRGMAERRTHIFPHPEWLRLWAERVERVTAQAAPLP
ncbi:SDR family NAD(P)-dependent oxidoreductase [Nocardia farcinica]|uniref:Putative short chain dehydrogenase n=1 Tax=Nocardia farcinica (strain IFM 10152) TaxID=247156 RepID=Q5YUB7_NOCFA|nr:SDR family NAD(P)-dependent oxidoreductase [Nocardia farcinica]PFX03589.1 putative oxidoreductase [Nocardia farcinica]PFX08739.1 putative oxidoreductase [Nocardia farcinica]BAD58224.1 putative short chain dehydrogenase [Nocardia farcinica IFM 10152]